MIDEHRLARGGGRHGQILAARQHIDKTALADIAAANESVFGKGRGGALLYAATANNKFCALDVHTKCVKRPVEDGGTAVEVKGMRLSLAKIRFSHDFDPIRADENAKCPLDNSLGRGISEVCMGVRDIFVIFAHPLLGENQLALFAKTLENPFRIPTTIPI